MIKLRKDTDTQTQGEPDVYAITMSQVFFKQGKSMAEGGHDQYTHQTGRDSTARTHRARL